MKTNDLEKLQPHLTRTDLERVTSLEEAETLHLRCHEEDCFVSDNELGVPGCEQDSCSIEISR